MSKVIAAVTLLVVSVAGWAAANPSTACAATGDRVAVAVDFGIEADAPADGPTTTCLPFTDGMTGADALALRAEALGTPPPRYADSGLLCAIDGYPAQGCGGRSGAGFLYWTYWKTDADRWVFGDEGPATTRLSPGGVTGWRFQQGTGSGLTESAPRTSARFTDLCGTVVASAAPAPGTVTPGSAAPRRSTAVQSRPRDSAASPATDAEPTTTTTVALADGEAEAASAARPEATGADDGSGPPYGLLVGAAAVVGLGATTGWRRRRVSRPA